MILMQLDSQISPENLPGVMDLAQDGCKQIAQYMQEYIRLYGEKIVGNK
jgi:ribonuclease PH